MNERYGNFETKLEINQLFVRKMIQELEEDSVFLVNGNS